MKSKLLFLIAFSCCLSLEAKLLEKGSISIGGHALVPLSWDAFGHLSVSVDVMPSASYFIFDQLESVASLRIQGLPHEPTYYGLQFGANYYFDWDLGFFPYIGLALGAQMADFKVNSSRVFIELPIGIAFVVSNSLLIQIGAPLRFILAPPGPTLGTAHIEWSPGFVGSSVFF